VDLLSTYSSHEQYADYLGVFVSKLVFHGNLEDAQVWLNKLQEVSPDSFRFVESFVRLEAKRSSFEAMRGNSKAIFPPTIFPAIKKYLDNKDRKVSDSDEVRLGRAATLLGELGRQYPEMMALNVAEGEKLLRSAAAKIGKKESLLPVANFLANCHQLDQSLNLCEQLLKDLPHTQVVPVAVVAVTLRVKPNLEQVRRVETWVRAGQRQDPKALAWEGFLAALKERQEKYTEAEDLYRKI
jgi:hypothetical protein